MLSLPPMSTRPDTLFPYPTLFRSQRRVAQHGHAVADEDVVDGAGLHLFDLEGGEGARGAEMRGTADVLRVVQRDQARRVGDDRGIGRAIGRAVEIAHQDDRVARLPMVADPAPDR